MPKGSRVLMADDDKMLIDMYKERLELAGYLVTVCSNGEEALSHIRETKPEIILLDIMMPKINGYEALASIKSDPATKDIPVIMLSALMRDFNREKAVEAGADDYLIKSEAMPADVITKIEQVLSKYGKGGSPLPGAVASNIPAPSATPPVAPTAPPVVPAMPVAPVVQPDAPITPPAPPIAPPENTDKQVVFTPAPPAEPKSESKPLSEIKAPEAKPANDLPTMPWEFNRSGSVAEKPQIVEKPERKPASVVLVVIIAILIATLVNDAIIYFFFFYNK